jgi:four helix bundle protein
VIFEDLLAWQQARCLVNSIYALTRRGELAKDFRLCGQLQAAAVSIMSNIAEGFERTHLQEKVQFSNVARGSTGEVRSLLYVVEENFSELVVHAKRLRGEADEIGKLITGLLESTVRRRGRGQRLALGLLSPISYLLSSSFFDLR